MDQEAAKEPLNVERQGAVAVIRLNRPEQRNALTHPMVAGLTSLLQTLDKDDATRAIVITGEGPAFCAGADLGGGPSDAEQTIRTLYNPLILTMSRLSTPMVAGINGIAAGAGCSLALACDLRVAASSAAFQLSFTKIGLVPDAGATWLLPRAIGTTRAAELMMLARKVGSADALRWNLVNEVVPDELVVKRSIELGHELAGLTSSLGATKRLLLDAHQRDLEGQLDAEATAQGIAQHSPDFIEVRAAFRDKRKPRLR